MYVANREVYKVNIKRKKEHAQFEVSKEETKEYQKNRSNPMDYERRNDNDGKWEKMIQKSFKMNSDEYWKQ